MGIVKAKELLRIKVYLPKLDDLVKEYLTRCIVRKAITTRRQHQSLNITKTPESLPIPSIPYLLAIDGQYSRFVIVNIVSNTSQSSARKP